MAATTSNDDPNSDSALLSLPAELRNRIYEYALAVVCPNDKVTISRHQPSGRGSGNGSVLRLLQTCRQIHEEARAIFYHENTLDLHPFELPTFVASMSPSRLVHIRSVRMTVFSTEIMDPPGPAWAKALLLLPGLRRLRLDFTNAAAYCAFFCFIDAELRHQVQVQQGFLEPPKNMLHSSLLQLRGLANLELSLDDNSFEVDKQKFRGQHQKAIMEANKTICEAVLKPKQDAESASEAQEPEKR